MVLLTDLASGETVFEGKGHTGRLTFVAVSADGKKLASGSHDGTVRVWDLAGEAEPPLLRNTGKAPIRGLACSPDGRWLAATQGPWLRLWDARTGRFVKEVLAGQATDGADGLRAGRHDAGRGRR